MAEANRLVAIASVVTTLSLVACSGPSEPSISDAKLARMHNRAAGLMGQYKFNEAVAVLKKLVKARPDSPDLRVDLAVARVNRRKRDDEEQATKMLQRLIDEHPDNLRAHYLLGAIRQQNGKTKAALRHFRTVAEADATDAHAAYYLGRALRTRKRQKEALRWFREAIERDPYLSSAYYQTRHVLAALGREAESKAIAKKVRRLEQNPLAHVADLTTYHKMGPKARVTALDEKSGRPARSPEGRLFAKPVPIPEG